MVFPFNTNGHYSVSGDRRGVFSSFTVIDGKLNEDVASSGNNYPVDAFGDGLEGSLALEVNGAEVHEVSLSDTVEAKTNDFNGNSSGFSVTAVGWSTTTDLTRRRGKDYQKQVVGGKEPCRKRSKTCKNSFQY